MIAALIESGSIALIAVAILVVEVGVLLVALRGRGMRLGLITNGLAGTTLLMALYAALTRAPATHVAVWLALGLLAHLADLATRLRAGRS